MYSLPQCNVRFLESDIRCGYALGHDLPHAAELDVLREALGLPEEATVPDIVLAVARVRREALGAAREFVLGVLRQYTQTQACAQGISDGLLRMMAGGKEALSAQDPK